MDKSSLRTKFLSLRQAIAPQAAVNAAESVAAQLLSLIPSQAIVAGYAAMRGELDVLPALKALHARGNGICLPCVVGKGQPLLFRRYDPDAPLLAGHYGALCPAESADVLQPDILLVPLLAFDAHLHRLGYGGGYYDRTIAGLRGASPARAGEKKIVAYGIAYAGQKVDALPTEAHDARLDAILTEKGIFR